jgi:hypothetical protein
MFARGAGVVMVVVGALVAVAVADRRRPGPM